MYNLEIISHSEQKRWLQTRVCVCFSVGGARWLTHMWVHLLSFPAFLLHPPIIWSKSTLAESDIIAELNRPFLWHLRCSAAWGNSGSLAERAECSAVCFRPADVAGGVRAAGTQHKPQGAKTLSKKVLQHLMLLIVIGNSLITCSSPSVTLRHTFQQV